MSADKIGVYTRFFEYANFRLPLSTFLVNVLKHYRIHISQLYVISVAKVSHFEILCRVHGFEPMVGLFRCFYVNSKNKGWVSFSKRPGNTATCYSKPLDLLKNWNDCFFWVDAFACPASFPWNASTTVLKDPFPNRYYTLDENTYPQFLRDNNEEIDLLTLIRTADSTKFRIGERQRGKDEPKLLDTTVGRTVPLLPVAPARAQSELDASVDSEAAEVVAEDVIPLRSRQRKRKTIVDAGEPSRLAKKLRDDYRAPGGPSVAGKSRFAVQRLFSRAILNAEVRGEPIPTLPFVTSSVTATPEHEDEHPADSVTGLNLQTISAPQRFVIYLDSSHHSAPAKEAPAKPSLFAAGSSSASGIDPVPGGFSDVSGSDFLVGGIRIVVDPEFDL
ncbi:hypothetical protein Tco_0169957 [Tanacetum coccineum]